MPAATPTVTAPCPAGVTVKVYVVPPPVKSPTVPFVTITSVASKPVTPSLNVTVTAIGLPFVGSGAVAVIATVGATSSNVTLLSLLVEAVFAFPAASFATPAASAAVTVPGPTIPPTATA